MTFKPQINPLSNEIAIRKKLVPIKDRSAIKQNR